MTAKRDSLFPAGRSQGASIIRTASRESLVAHPLLSPGPSSTTTTSPDTSTQTSSAKYVPYTPRQRQPTTATAASLPVSATPQPQSSAGGKAQLVNLKAQVQAMGLDTGSVGWSILEKLSYEGDSSEEWSDIWNAVTKGRATLLLPSDQPSSHETITPELVQDHVIICDLPSRKDTPVVTLSGLRGHLVNDVLTFRSALSRTTKQFQDLFASSSSRTSALDALPPLPHYPHESSYPSWTISGVSASLTLPARSTKPPLPPRPGIGRSTTTQSSARLSMPFASLFGQRPSTPPIANTALPPTTTSPASQPSEIDQVIEVSAFTITSTVSRKDISNAIVGALKAEIAVALADQPPWIVERVHSFALPLFPFVKMPAGKKKLHDIGGNPNRVSYAVNAMLDKPDELADKFQEFYRAIEGELRDGRHAPAGAGKDKDKEEADASSARHREKAVNDDKSEDEREARIRDVLEIIESTLCTLLYDRLFLPSTSDDASHDEALSSRIAALNMLDLGLEHLDIDIGNADHAEVNQVVRTCGQTLAQLDIFGRSPREKAAILVSAHKLVVEGLSKIPPIRLKSGEEKENVTKPSSDPEHESTASAAPGSSSVPPAPTSELTTENRSPLIPTVTLTTSPDHPSILKPPPSPEIIPSTISSPVSGDVLLPVIIFAVVKANPAKLVSHLLYTQRFRNQSFGGEESYCLINLMAVAEFLENVDLGALGLGESEKKVISTADLTPISITRPNMTPESPIAVVLQDDHSGSLRGRVEQGVDAIAGSANKVISGVVDSSFGVLRALLPLQINANSNNANSNNTNGSSITAVPPTGSGETTDSALWSVRPGLGLLRRETGFSIAGLAAALPGQAKAKSNAEGEGQRELVQVSSCPSSVRSHKTGQDEESGSERSDEEGSEEGESDSEDGSEGGDGEEGGGDEDEDEVHDTRSIKSFESMLSSGRSRRKSAEPLGSSKRRKALTDLTDRLAHGMVGMSRRGRGREQGESHKVSSPNERLTGLPPMRTSSSPNINVPAPTISIRLPPPNRRFVECTEQDIRVSEVGELLREYQRLVEAVRSAGGFSE